MFKNIFGLGNILQKFLHAKIRVMNAIFQLKGEVKFMNLYSSTLLGLL